MIDIDCQQSEVGKTEEETCHEFAYHISMFQFQG